MYAKIIFSQLIWKKKKSETFEFDIYKFYFTRDRSSFHNYFCKNNNKQQLKFTALEKNE